MIKAKITYQPFYEGYPIMANQDLNQGCYSEILDKIVRTIADTTERHNKVLAGRFDVRFPKEGTYPPDNDVFKKFISHYAKDLKRQKLDPSYIWAREQSREKHHHYHCALLLDGSKTQSLRGHLARAEELWKNALGTPNANGLIDYCDRTRHGEPQTNAVMLRRDDPALQEKIDDFAHRCSYLAKVNTKGYAPKRVRQYGCSELPKRVAEDRHERD